MNRGDLAFDISIAFPIHKIIGTLELTVNPIHPVKILHCSVSFTASAI